MIEGITVYNFYVEMIAALSLFVFRLPRRRYFALRLAGALAVLCGLWYLFVIYIPDTNDVWNTFKFILLFAGFFGGILLCWKVGFEQALFCAIVGYCVQHVIYKLNVLLLMVLIAAFAQQSDIVWLYWVATPLMYLVVWLLWGRKGYDNPTVLRFSVRAQMLLALALLVCTTFVSEVFSFEFCNYDILIYLAIVCLDIVFASFIFIVQINQYQAAELRFEMAETERIHYMERQQLEQTKEMIDVINIKSHDLKHQLLRIGGKVDEAETAQLLQTISLYDGAAKTENEALNVVLMQKGITFSKSNIVFTPMIDASGLSMMRDSDVYSLFGNLLDNAAEAVQKLPEQRRNISLIIKNAADFLSIHVENEYGGEILRFRGGLPETSKADKTVHGFGMKSIAAIVKKYGGTLKVDAADHVFTVDILFPLREGEREETA